jgi:DNA-binding CsgD family transcriptional regulator
MTKPRDLTLREIEIVAAYMSGKQSLAEICKLYEISPAAIGVLMAARYGCGSTAETNSDRHKP